MKNAHLIKAQHIRLLESAIIQKHIHIILIQVSKMMSTMRLITMIMKIFMKTTTMTLTELMMPKITGKSIINSVMKECFLKKI